MEIALITIDKNNNMLQFAGAMSPLYLIRKISSDTLNKDEEFDHNIEKQTVETSQGESLQLIEIYADRMPISIHKKVNQQFKNHNLQLKKDDNIYLFTDGYIDQFGGEKGKRFKSSKFKELLINIQDIQIKEQELILRKKIDEWKGYLEQVDDILVMGIRI